jgi:hypothetical protein
MLFAKSKRSRLSHDTSYEGNSKPTPGPSSLPMLKLEIVSQCVRCRRCAINDAQLPVLELKNRNSVGVGSFKIRSGAVIATRSWSLSRGSIRSSLVKMRNAIIGLVFINLVQN